MNGLMSTVREITQGGPGRGSASTTWLGSLVGTVAETLGVPFAALEVDGRIVTGVGAWPERVERVPLGYGVETVGALVLPPVRRRDALLLDALVGQLARAVRAASVAEAAVHASRELAGAHVPGGLVAALTAARALGGAAVEVWPLPALHPAVEAAAYRIAVEALTNAARHAPGAPARVRIRTRGDFLDVAVTDSGPGVPAGFTAGAGVHAMRGWAAAVGGVCVVRRGLPGTLVEAMLPLVPAPVVPAQRTPVD